MDLYNITLFCAMKATQLHLFCRSVCLDTLTKISHKSLNYDEQYNLYCLGKKIRRLLVQFQINRKLLSPGSLKRLTRTEPAILHLLKNKSHSFTWNCTFVEYFCISKFFWFVLNSVWDAVSCFYEENENNETRLHHQKKNVSCFFHYINCVVLFWYTRIVSCARLVLATLA